MLALAGEGHQILQADAPVPAAGFRVRQFAGVAPPLDGGGVRLQKIRGLAGGKREFVFAY